MDSLDGEEFDVIILGTGITECILSGILSSTQNKKILHIDKQNYYGGDTASINLKQLFERNDKPTENLDNGKFGRARDWNIDMIPKLLMSNGELINILISTKVTEYLEFKQISGSYVYHKNGKIYKVPSTEYEAVTSSLLGLFEKNRVKNFLQWVSQYNFENPKTHQGINWEKNTMEEVYYKFGLGNSSQDFIGHAMALYPTDDYIKEPCKECIERIILYSQSVAKFGAGKSPYLYPLYGLGELPQAFARLSALYGGIYMLNTPVSDIQYFEDGKFKSLTIPQGTVKAPIVIADPSYFPEKVKSTGKKYIRCICLLNHKISSTDQRDSLQIILPQNQIGRKNDIYIAALGAEHFVTPKGWNLAIVSTILEDTEGKNPLDEIKPALTLLGEIEETFYEVKEILAPKEDGSKDNVFISKSYDAMSHFESMTEDVKDIYKRVMGEDLVIE